MATDNLSVVLHGIEDLRVEQRPIPKFSDDEVLLAIDSVGICGSDVHFLVHGRIGDYVAESPLVLGHEASGIVHKIGKNVTNLKVGDRVAIEMGIPCRICKLCKNGRYNLCPKIKFGSTPPYDGALTKFMAHAADYCFKLPDNVTMEEGALLEPLSVGIHACRRAHVGLGSEVVILGAGPIGLVTLLTAKAMGASKVLIVDLLENRLKIAKEFGADYVLQIKKDETEEEIVRNIHSLMEGAPDITMDCTGSEATNRLSVLATVNGGCALIVGNGPLNVNLPIMNVVTREVDIRGIFRYTNTYPTAIALVASGKIDVKKLVTHHYDLSETKDAFHTSRYGIDGAIKVMIHVQPRNSNNKSQ
jgi:L-iditol 2-dehydrogenase